MNKMRISLAAGTALLALAGTASAGPLSAASPQIVTPKPAIEQVYYRYHPRRYGYRHRYYRYGWNPGAAAAGAALGLATIPFAAAAGWPYYGYYRSPYPYYPYYPY